MSNNDLHTDKRLFALISEGDQTAFKQWYALLLPDCASYIFKLLKSEDGVKEVLQESLVRLWLNRDKLPAIDHPRAWFLKIISNECLRYLRKHGLRQRLAAALEVHEPFHQTEADISFRETQRIIAQAVAKLSARQQLIYRLSREQGLTLPEIAEKLGLSRDYVKKTLMVALERIRQPLIKAGRMLPLLLLWRS